MSRLSIGPDGRTLARDGAPHVPLLDTVWNAFAEIDGDEWADYLRRRREQGFTGILVSLLPTLHDRSENAGSRMPFRRRPDGALDPDAPDEEYFETARRMAQGAVAEGFDVFLVVLWSNYLAGSPSNELPPRLTLGSEARMALADRVLAQFRDLGPVLVISGDDPFDADGSVEVYRELGERFAREAPELLRTFHAWPDAVVPDALVALSDLVTLQSGHTADGGAKAIEIAERELARGHGRPLINAEPCYEGHGHVRSHGRFSRDEVRRVLWTGLLAGAAAGLGYGAHGVWQWHRAGSTFTQAAFSGMPFSWATALRLPGADDAAFARDRWEAEGFAGALPAQELAGHPDDGTRVAVRGDRVAIYLPSARAVRIAAPLRQVRAWALADRRPIRLVAHVDDDTLLEQAESDGDVIVFARRDRPTNTEVR